LASSFSETKIGEKEAAGKFLQVQQNLDLCHDVDVELGVEARESRETLTPASPSYQSAFPPLLLVERVVRSLGTLGLLLVVECVPHDRLLRLELFAVLVQRQDLRNVVIVLVRAPACREELRVE
jgi:hypothetical protein